ncbi:MAG: cysteine hydrolase [Clostridia bacterium]|nr:cysteine hydrolase [Clostridia bacterium]
MQNILLVIDMQTDFVDGVLGSKEACAIVPAVREKILRHTGKVYFTRDTHAPDYMETREGKRLPVPHCIRGTDGWQIHPALRELPCDGIIDKPTFGSVELMERLTAENTENPIGQITLIGVCTDICVISNAMLLKAALPEVDVVVDAACCAGVTPDSHATALAAMKACQIDVVNE